MVIKPEQLLPQLKKALSPCYWLSGDDGFLRECLEKDILAAAQAQGYEQIRRYQIGVDFDITHFIQDNQNFGLFSNKIIYLIRSDKALDANLGQELSTFLENPPSDICLVLSTGRTTGNTPKWHKHLSEQAIFIPLWPLDIHALPQWIRQQAQKYALRFSPAQTKQLAETYEGNLPALANIFLQLSIHGPGQVKDDALDALLSQQAHYQLFDFASAVFNGEASRAISILQYLEEYKSNDLSSLIGFFAKELRTLATLKVEQRHTALPELFKRLRIWPKQQTAFQAALTHWSYPQILETLLALAELDLIIKGLRPGSPWQSLYHLTLALPKK